MINRIHFIDIAKAFAIIIIVFGHTCIHSIHSSEVYNFLYSFNIALFFILSGYTFKVKENYLSFAKKKFIRIMIPYFIWSFLFIVPFILFGQKVGNSLHTSQSFDLFEIIKNTFYGNGVNDSLKQNTSLWFLPALFSMEMVYYHLVKNGSKRMDFVKLVLLILIGFLTSQYLNIYLPWGINTVLQIGGSTFYIGFLLQKYKLLNKLFKIIPMVFVMIIGVSFYLLNNDIINYVNYQYGNYFYTIIIGLSFSIIVIFMSYLINQNNFIEYLGKSTMGILIFHKIIIIICQSKLGYISKLLRNSNLFTEIIISIIISLISIFVSIIITNAIRKTLPFLVGEGKQKTCNIIK